MNKTSEHDIENALNIFRRFKDEQAAQKMRGLNDFNLFTILLDKYDEVRLHSRFLHTLLDPFGSHGQNSLFLDLFLQKCKLPDTGINTSACHVHKEYGGIDLYITDGTKHIIIENKIYAGDQDRQIERYIDKIKDENKNDINISDNIFVIYLSMDRLRPSDESLGSYKYSDSFLIKNDEKYIIKSITYNNEILDWIRSSKEQIVNITNLSVILTQYEDVILMLNNQYKDKLMILKDYIDKQEDSLSILNTLKQINEEYSELRKSMISDFFDKANEGIEKKCPDRWSVVLDNDNLSTAFNYPLRIEQSENSQVLFGFEFGRSNYHDPYFGVVRRDDSVDLKICTEDEEINLLIREIKKPLAKTARWWLAWEYYAENDIFDNILQEGGIDKSVLKFVEKFMGSFNSYKDVIVACNRILDK